MKMTRRIFIALLILAVSISSFAVFASADEAEFGVQDYVNVLEYYEEQSLVDVDFGNGGAEYASVFFTNSARAAQYVQSVVADETAPNGKYLSVAVKERSGRSAYTDNHSYFGWTSDVAIDDFNIDMTVSGDKYNSSTTENEEHLPKIIIVVNDTAFAPMTAANTPKTGTTLAAVDYRGGFFTYLKNGTEYKTEYAIEEGAWYNVSLTYDADAGVSITITNCADAEKTLTVTDGDAPFQSVKDVRIGAHGDDAGSARGTLVKYADVRILGGVYHRDYANMQADIENKLLGMGRLFDDDSASIEDKIAVCEVVKSLNTYGFTTENAEVQAVLDALGVGVIGLYNTKLEEFSDKLASLETFEEKKEYVDLTSTYAKALSELDFTGVSPELVAKSEQNIANFEAAKSKFLESEGDSARFLQLVDSIKDHDINDYAVLTADLALFEGCEPDLTYEGVADAYKHYSKLVEAEETIRTSAETFIAAVSAANDDALDFNARAEAYKTITAIYFDNETYPGVTEAIAGYNAIRDYMNLEISNAENFVKYVNRADYALYISAKQENLDIAKTYMDICQPDFAGVAEAKLLYVEVQAYIEQQIANANAYINAVNALDSLSGTALLNGIKNAQSLQEAGNVLGVDGVTEANIKLNQIIASIELVDRYCIHFVNLVNSIDKVTSTAELYELLAEAKEAEADADSSYAGVADASAKLAKAIADLNAQVNAINAEFENANNVAANSCGVGENGTAVSGHVIALVKKFFDEE